jgi:hypothetical protein
MGKASLLTRERITRLPPHTVRPRADTTRRTPRVPNRRRPTGNRHTEAMEVHRPYPTTRVRSMARATAARSTEYIGDEPKLLAHDLGAEGYRAEKGRIVWTPQKVSFL